MRCQVEYRTMAPPNSAGLLAISSPWRQGSWDQVAVARGDYLSAPIGCASSMDNSDSITAQVKARSRIYHWATLAYESTHYPPMIKIKNLDLSCDINHGSTIVNTLSYEIRPHLQLSIKDLANHHNPCGNRRISSAIRARHCGKKIHVGDIKAFMSSDEWYCCRKVGTGKSG